MSNKPKQTHEQKDEYSFDVLAKKRIVNISDELINKLVRKELEVESNRKKRKEYFDKDLKTILSKRKQAKCNIYRQNPSCQAYVYRIHLKII